MKYLRIGLLIMGLGLLLLLSVLLTTPSGLRYVLNQLDQALPASLSVSSVEGGLVGPLTLQGIRYQHGQQLIELRRLQLDWHPWSLLRGELRITRLQGAGLKIALPPPEDDGAAPSTAVDTLAPVRLPLNVRLQELSLADILIQPPAQTSPLHVQQLKLQARTVNNTLRLNRLALEAAPLRLDVTGLIAFSAHYPLALKLNWAWHGGEGYRLAAAGDLNGDLQQLILRQQLQQPTAGQLTLRGRDLLGALHWDAELKIPRLENRHLPLTIPQRFHTAIDLSAEGDRKSLHTKGQLLGELEAVGAVEARFQLQHAAEQLKLHALNITLPESAAQLETQGWLRLEKEPRFQLAGNWHGLHWPLQQTPLIRSEQGHFDLQGQLDDYRFATELKLSGNQIPSAQWQLRGHGRRHGLNFEQITATGLLDGQLSANGELVWAPQLQTSINLQADALNPGKQWPDWPGKINLSSRIEAQVDTQGPQLALNLKTLSGELRGRSLAGHTQLRWQNQQWQIAELRLQAGQASLDARGHIDEQLHLVWKAAIPRLDDLLPNAQGSLHAHGSVQGAQQQPQLELTLDASELQWRGYHAKTLMARASVDLADRKPSHVEVKATALQAAQFTIHGLSLLGNGPLHDHQLELAINSAQQQSLALTLQAGLHQQQWQGQITALNLQDATLGSWQLQQAVPFHLAMDSAALADSCLHQHNASLCLKGQWQASSDSQAELRVVAVPLALLQPYLPSAYQLQGQLNGEASLVARDATIRRARVNMNLDDSRLLYTLPRQSQQREVRLHQGSLRLSMEDRQPLTGTLNLDFNEQERLTANLQIKPPASTSWSVDALMRQDLQASVQGKLRDLSLLELASVEIDRAEGQLDMDLHVRGSIEQPRLSGQLRLAEGHLEIPRLNLRLKQIQLQANADAPTNIQVSGRANSGEGWITLQGQINYRATPWQLQLQIDGERFELARIPEARLQVSPKLVLRIEPYRIDLQGELTIPEARIEPRDISLAKQPSSDVVISGQTATTGQPATPRWQIHSRVHIIAPDSIRFIGYGLDARIGGDLRIIEEPKKLTRARGELHVVKGSTYKAFGQQLKTEQGQLIFADSTLDNPDLNITAVRQVGDIVAGVVIRGSARQPQLTLFSRPAMDEANMLSYITLGRPISRVGSQGDGQTLATAANTAGLVGGDYLAGYIGRQFGLEEARLESQPDTEQPWLVLGTYLSPRLYVRYGVNLIQPGNSVLLRYQLSEHWQVQGETGRNSGTDLIYSFERP